ncbi:MAG: lamin tail domain-containing protein [Anaerolineae bacterium]|nr:lamin tail domain-containing protein [Anaerolineae bacterium]
MEKRWRDDDRDPNVDLSRIPKDTCPLCRQVALDRSGVLWHCRACGCKLEFDPRTLRSRILHFPDDYAAFESSIGTAWLTRREMFERAEKAHRAHTIGEYPNVWPWLGPTAIVALTLIATFIILAAIAAALVLSPSLARTRRAISAAYQPTLQATVTPLALAAGTDIPVTDTSDWLPLPEPTPPAGVPADLPTNHSEGEVAALPIPTPMLPPDLPQPNPTAAPPAPDIVLSSPLPQPEIVLPPTFTPSPPLELQPTAVNAAPTLAASDPTPTPLPTPQDQAMTPTVTPAPTLSPGSTPQPTPTPFVMGPVIFQGTVRILSVQPLGGGPNQAYEFVELYNEGPQQVNLTGWTLKAIRTSDNTVIATFRFGNGAVIAAGQLCRIYTNVLVAPDNCGFSGGFASNQPIWPDNGGARASLFNQDDVEFARFTY